MFKLLEYLKTFMLRKKRSKNDKLYYQLGCFTSDLKPSETVIEGIDFENKEYFLKLLEDKDGLEEIKKYI